jgi:hypothetical protein
MLYVIVGAVGAALIAATWLAWRSRHPLRLLRAVLTALLVIATGLGVELVRELGLATAARGS